MSVKYTMTQEPRPPRRVLHIIHQYPPDFVGGSELATQTVAQELAARGMAVALLTRIPGTGHGLRRSEEAGVTVYRAWDGAPGPGARYLASFGRGPLLAAFDRVVAEFAPDLVHVQHLLGWPLAILARLRRCRLPTVITLHDYWWVCANALLLTNYDATVCAGPRGHLNCTRCAVARGGARLWPAAPALWASLRRRADLLRRGAAAADLLITPSAFVAEWHAAQGFPAARVRPLGIDLTVGPRTRTPARPLRLAMIGGLSSQKGVHVAVNAVSRYADDMTLTVAGTGEDTAYVADLQRRAGPNVTWAGRLERAGVAALLAASDAVLVPSLSYETFSLTLHEAWAAGVPVIASDLGVMARAVRHDVDGLLVPPGDMDAWAAALARLAAAPEELTRLAQGIQPLPTVAHHVDLLQQDYADVWAARARSNA